MTAEQESKLREADRLLRDILDHRASSMVANIIEAHGLIIDAISPADRDTPVVETEGWCRSCRKWKLPCATGTCRATM